MAEPSIREARSRFTEIIGKAASGKERYTVVGHGRAAVAMIRSKTSDALKRRRMVFTLRRHVKCSGRVGGAHTVRPGTTRARIDGVTYNHNRAG
jgi:hypothetical protein